MAGQYQVKHTQGDLDPKWVHTPHTRRVEEWERETPTGTRKSRKLGRMARSGKKGSPQ